MIDLVSSSDVGCEQELNTYQPLGGRCDVKVLALHVASIRGDPRVTMVGKECLQSSQYIALGCLRAFHTKPHGLLLCSGRFFKQTSHTRQVNQAATHLLSPKRSARIPRLSIPFPSLPSLPPFFLPSIPSAKCQSLPSLFSFLASGSASEKPCQRSWSSTLSCAKWLSAMHASKRKTAWTD